MRNVNRAQVNVTNIVVAADRQDRTVVVGMITLRDHLPRFPRLHRPRFMEAGWGYWQGLALKKRAAAARKATASKPGSDQSCHSTGRCSGGRRLPCSRSECIGG
jgi:hypothetical protein